MSSDYCCGIEIRLGTIILTVISLIISIFFASVFFAKPDIVSYGLPRALTIVFGVLFILFVLSSIFGIIGILFNSPGGIKLYAYILWGAVIIYIGLIAIVVINIIRTKQEAIDLCIKQAGKEGTQNVGESAKNTNNNIKEDCNNREVAKILINSIVLLLSTLFTMSLAIKSARYSRNLYRAIMEKSVYKEKSVVQL